MIPFTLAFLCGILFLLFGFIQIPPITEVGILLLFSGVLLFYKRKIYYLIFIFILGFSYTIFIIYLKTSWTLPHSLEGKTINMIGRIASIPNVTPDATVFLFQYHHVLIRLHWKTEYKLKVGDEWQIPVKLKRIHGLQNPGGFDYEAWAFSEGIRATGYVTKGEVKKISEHHFSIQYLRQKIYDQMVETLPESTTSPWIVALALGERHHILAENWQILRNTGTNHLMAIAGLHVGFMSGFIYALTQFIWRRISFLTLWIPSQLAASFAALCMVIIYSALAGFSIPTERASLMFVIFVIMMMLKRNIHIWNIYSVALLVVLLINPLNVLSVSFWLSFISVALIIYGMKGRLHPKGWWWKHGRIQWLLAISLIPISIALFQECSMVSFIANSIAIPWMGFFILPFILIGTFSLFFSTKISLFFLILADHSLEYLWKILTYLSQISWGTWHHAFNHPFIFILSLVGILILLLPQGCKERWLGIVWLLPLFFYQPEKPKLGEVWFTLLDVGQGLSAIVETQSHVLIYDTGPKSNANYDMGESVVLPFLRTRLISHVDMLVVSHGDNDHSGGVDAILKSEIPIFFMKTSVPQKFTSHHPEYCLYGDHWVWDQVEFTFLYPTISQLGLGNNSSCVLKISNGKHSILLTGDIEKKAEKYLTKFTSDELTSDIMVAPHHGSKTSMMKDFIQHVHPKRVLFPIGYLNRYHFPHPKVIQEYIDQKIIMHDTVQSGAIQVRLNNQLSFEFYRLTHVKLWNKQY